MAAVFVSRVFHGTSGPVELIVYEPTAIDVESDDSDYTCAFEIVGGDPSPFRMTVTGIDSMQALLLACGCAKATLQSIQGLTFLDGPDLGLPDPGIVGGTRGVAAAE